VNEVPFVGGNISNATRVGDTVRRMTGPWTPAVHSVLRHLLPTRMRHGYEYVRERAAAGEPGFVKIWTFTDGLENVLRDAEHAERDRDALLPD
jgi:hypothetical protein